MLRLEKSCRSSISMDTMPKTRVAEQPKPPGSADFVLKSKLEAVTQRRSNHIAVFATLILLPHIQMDIIFCLVTVLSVVHNHTKQVQIHLPRVIGLSYWGFLKDHVFASCQNRGSHDLRQPCLTGHKSICGWVTKAKIEIHWRTLNNRGSSWSEHGSEPQRAHASCAHSGHWGDTCGLVLLSAHNGWPCR